MLIFNILGEKNDIVSFFQTLIAIKPLEVSGEDASSTYVSNL